MSENDIMVLKKKEKNEKEKKKKDYIIVLAIYIVLTAILTYPVAFSDKIAGDGGDGYWYMWDLWWFKTSLLNLDNPYYTTYIYYPVGVNLAFSAVTQFNAILSIPLQSIFGLILAYNILWLMSFFIAGYGTYLLVKYLTNDIRASFVSGLIFMFSPYHFAQGLGHLSLATIEWIPFYILFLFKTVQEKDNRKVNIRNASFFLFLVAISDYYYLVFVLFFTMIFILYYIFKETDISKEDIMGTMKRLSIMIIIFILMFFPFAYPMLKEFLTSEYMYIGGFVDYSADLLAFFIPTQFHPIFKDYVSPIYKNFTGNWSEYHTFIGYSVLFLTSLAIYHKNQKTKFWTKFWILSTIIFFILSLGPILHINGILSIPIEGYVTYVPLPYLLINKIPIISIARVPSRWDVLVMMSFAILAGYGLNYLNNKQSNTRNKSIISMFFSGIIIFEFLAIPYPMSNGNVPKFYYELVKDSENYAILEVPGHAVAKYMYYQTIHKKRLVNGYTSRAPKSSIELVSTTPLIRDLLDPPMVDTVDTHMVDSKVKNSIINVNMADTKTTNIGNSILNFYDIRYIIVHKNYLKKEQIKYIDDILINKLKYERKIYDEDEDDENEDDRSLIVYQVKKTPLAPFMILNGDSWYGLEQDFKNNYSWQWTSNNASIFIYSVDSSLSMDMMTFYRRRLLYIYLNDELVYQQYIVDNSTNNVRLKIRDGENMIRFYSPDGCQRPIDIFKLNSRDPRCLSIAFTNISLINK